MAYYSGQGDYYRGMGDPGLPALIGAGLGAARTVLGRVFRKPGAAAGAAVVGTIAPMIPQLRGRVHPSGALPGGRPLFTRRSIIYRDGEAPRGYHLNKQDGKYGPARSYYVRNRRTNPLNARALRRGISRLNGAERLLRRILQVKGKRAAKIVPKGTRRKNA